jgi:diguanylate cyclase (GGDEF)-like protein
METSSAVDDAAEVRVSLVRYAAGLRAYVKRKRKEDVQAMAELLERARELEERISSNQPSAVDPKTGLLNRAEAVKQMQAQLDAGKPFSVLLAEWLEAGSIPSQFGDSGAAQIVKRMGGRLATFVRHRDPVYCWGPDRFAVILNRSGNDLQDRAQSMAECLSTVYSAVVDGKVWKVKATVAVRVIDPAQGESVAELIRRIDEGSGNEVRTEELSGQAV